MVLVTPDRPSPVCEVHGLVRRRLGNGKETQPVFFLRAAKLATRLCNGGRGRPGSDQGWPGSHGGSSGSKSPPRCCTSLARFHMTSETRTHTGEPVSSVMPTRPDAAPDMATMRVFWYPDSKLCQKTRFHIGSRRSQRTECEKYLADDYFYCPSQLQNTGSCLYRPAGNGTRLCSSRSIPLLCRRVCLYFG